ncbi:MAG: periplasmic protein TonB [Sphingomonadales bacterium]|jgi:protein TonB|nr:periplasmic protein TonB [Sphingomonadales bacterium]
MNAELNATQDRLKAGLPTLAVHLLLVLAVLRGLAADPAAPPPEAIQLIDLAPPPPPAVATIPPVRERSRQPEGAASPPNLESQRTDIVAPPVLPPLPQPIVTAATAGTGADPSAGSADVPGPGTGSGGVGNGTGSGGRGNGPGGGGDGDGDGAGLTPPRRIRGSIRDSDYPRGAGAAGIGGMVSVIYAVETDGRATHCEITRSSGSPELDSTTCRLIEQRFRFRPSQNRSGRPIRSRIVQDHYWETHDEAPVHEPPVRRRRLFGL